MDSSSFLVVSNILLWCAVVGLFFLVFVLVRQVGVLYERIAPAGALMVGQKLQVGDKAPQMQVRDVNSADEINIGYEHADKSQLLFFVSPDCPVCKSLLSVVKSVRNTEKRWLDVVLATDYDAHETEAFIAEYDLNDFAFANSQPLGQSYGVAKLPYGVLVDDHGIVKSMGLINSREHFESLFIAKETDTASIQSYLRQAHSERPAVGNQSP